MDKRNCDRLIFKELGCLFETGVKRVEWSERGIKRKKKEGRKKEGESINRKNREMMKKSNSKKKKEMDEREDHENRSFARKQAC